jgi:TolA-binding protein
VRKFVFSVIAGFLIAHYGWSYLTSPKFQEFGDRKKYPWTCQINNWLGNYEKMWSHPNRAIAYFEKTLQRCPKSRHAEEALFRIAECYSDAGRKGDAIGAFRQFMELYPDSKRAELAARSESILRGNF